MMYGKNVHSGIFVLKNLRSSAAGNKYKHNSMHVINFGAELSLWILCSLHFPRNFG